MLTIDYQNGVCLGLYCSEAFRGKVVVKTALHTREKAQGHLGVAFLRR